MQKNNITRWSTAYGNRLLVWITSCCHIKRYSPLHLFELASGVKEFRNNRVVNFLLPKERSLRENKIAWCHRDMSPWLCCSRYREAWASKAQERHWKTLKIKIVYGTTYRRLRWITLKEFNKVALWQLILMATTTLRIWPKWGRSLTP